MTKPLLMVDRVSKRFGGHQAVDEVSFQLDSGVIGGLIGPNGAGKSTLFNCLAGHIKPTSGSIQLNGKHIAGLGADEVFHAGMARTFQIPRPFPQMTLLDNVMVAPAGQLGERFWTNWLQPRRVREQESKTRDDARYWLNFVGLSRLEDKPASILSGGQRKLLDLARVMVANPKLVLLDEPAAGVNPALLDQIVDKVAALNAQGITFLLIEHNTDLISTLCNPVMVMAQGALIKSGHAEEVLSDPQVVEAYLGTEA